MQAANDPYTGVEGAFWAVPRPYSLPEELATAGEHILYWMYATSLEHAISFPYGGTSDPGNLITACYQCNDIKNKVKASELGWKIAPVGEAEWDGLAGYLPQLLDAKSVGKQSHR